MPGHVRVEHAPRVIARASARWQAATPTARSGLRTGIASQPHTKTALTSRARTIVGSSSVYRFVVPAGSRVLEIGCGTGDLLAALAPEGGVGVDFSPAMLAEARRRYPNLQFVEADAHDLSAVEGTFDVIVLSDLLDDVWDVQALLERPSSTVSPRHARRHELLQPAVGDPAEDRGRAEARAARAQTELADRCRYQQPVLAVRLPCDPDVAGSPVPLADPGARPSCEPRPRTPVGDSQPGAGEFHDRTPAPTPARR